MTERTTCVPYETLIGQFQAAIFTSEALRVPVSIHRLNHSSNDELATFAAAGRKENLEVSFAVLTSLEFIKNAISELLEALGTPRNKRSLN